MHRPAAAPQTNKTKKAASRPKGKKQTTRKKKTPVSAQNPANKKAAKQKQTGSVSKASSNSSAKKKKKKSFLSGRRKAVLVSVLCVIVVVGFAMGYTSQRKNRILAEGLTYLKTQETRETQELEKTLQRKQRERMLAAVQSGQSSIFSLYRNALIFGDSRVYGFGSYGFVPFEQVLAEAGATINNIPDNLEIVKKTQPEKIYFSYGVNDMGLQIGSDRGENGYAQVYEEMIDQVLEASPNSQIIINSILPATPARLADAPRWKDVDQYNAQIEEMCKKRGWTYIDNSELADGGNADIYQADGVHLLPDFYPVWAQNMIFSAS